MILAAETYSKSTPLGYRPQDETLLETRKSESLPQAGLRVLENVECFEDGAAFIRYRLVRGCFRSSTPHRIKFKKRMRYIFAKHLERVKDTPLVHVTNHYSQEYYHWLFDSMPRLLLARRGGSPMRVVLGQRHREPHILESLRRLGLEDAIFLPTYVGVQADRLLLPDYPAPDRIHRSELLTELHELFVPNAVPSPRRRIYVSRSKARFRKIINEPALMGLLGRFGFESVVAEDLDFNEQVRLFSQCSVLLSNHGAGLANLLFLPKGAWVIECRKDQNGMVSDGRREPAARYNTYYHASDALGLRYGYLACPSPEPDRSCYQADITVDLYRLERLLNDAGLGS